MKIVFFNYLPLEYGGGLAEYYRQIAHDLHRTYPENDYTILTLDTHFAKKIARLYSLYFFRNKHEMSLTETRTRIQRSLPGITYASVSSLQTLAAYVETQDIVYTKNDILELVLLHLTRTKRRPPIIIGYHTPLYYEQTPSIQAKLHNLLYGSAMYRSLCRIAQIHHTLNAFDTQYLQERMSGKIVQLYNPFDFSAFAKQAQKAKRSFKKQRGVKNVLWIGRVTEQKGVRDLVEIITRVNATAEGKRIHWIIAGVGDEEDLIRNAQREQLNVTYLGFVSRNDIARLYQRSDIFISTSKWESLPYTFLEAISFSLPIITYKIHGITELIPSRKYGFPVSTIDEFVDTIRLLAKRDNLMKTTRSMIFRNKFDKKLLLERFYTAFLKPYE